MIPLIYIVLFYIFLAKTLRFFHLHGRAYEPLLVWSIRTENLSTSGKKLSYLMAKTNHYTLSFLFFLCVDHVIHIRGVEIGVEPRNYRRIWIVCYLFSNYDQRCLNSKKMKL